MLGAQLRMKVVDSDRNTEFLKDCSEHMSSFIKAMILQDRLHGLVDTGASIKNLGPLRYRRRPVS